ncbi:PREDICTED: receptor-type tyrosine-protein phosphatase eta [Ficedula albicollis]|uniref:receptor-type tyrosine-protein phosphatase eta n=1 Tax=Ficedula albicollis TaxID=59894 RepID=UPI0007AD7CB6|nr:PREDICTED: receptor-type tyrosine-protein phosphatase eta [Ficedula albicollis]
MGKDKAVRSGSGSVGPLFCNLHNNAALASSKYLQVDAISGTALGDTHFPVLQDRPTVRCTIACTENCSSESVTAEPATSSNDDLSVNSASGNRISAGGRVIRAASLFDETREPSPIYSITAESNVTSVKLKWVLNESASDWYKLYEIQVANRTADKFVMSLETSKTEAEITGLIPGTLYNFTVFAVAADKNKTEGVSIELYTKPSRVHNLTAESVGVTSVKLKWDVNDSASASYTYRIEVVNGTDGTLEKNQIYRENKAEITGLIPGTLYNFTVFAVAGGVNGTEGDGVTIDLYTKPSPVDRLIAESIGATSAKLKWHVNDIASGSYTYKIEVKGGTLEKNLETSKTEAEITGLIPWTPYNFTVFAVAADDETEGEGVSIELYTKPSRVHNLTAESVGVTSVKLKWDVNDSASASYTYRIEVVNGTDGTVVKNQTSIETKAEITDLIPGTLYNFTVFAVAGGVDGTEGDGVTIEQYTRPSRVHNLTAESIGVTSVTLKWDVNDSASESYTYRIEVVNGTDGTLEKNQIYRENKAEITGLIPGTLYNFTVFAVAGGVNGTEGDGVTIDLYTSKSHRVHNLTAESIGVTSVTLKWDVNDSASESYTYRIEVVNGTDDPLVKNQTSIETKAEITDLIPGTPYNFTVFAVAADDETEGEGVTIELYTRPSRVHNLTAESIGVTSVTLKWDVNDSASESYTYRIEVVNGTDDPLVKNQTSIETKAEITDLIPGTPYNFTVFAVAADDETEGEGVTIELYTRPSRVHNLTAESIGVTSVTLKWEVNDIASDSYTYRIEFVNDTFVKSLTFSDTKAEITDLIPGTPYNFTVFAVAADDETEGEGVTIELYTRPRQVHNLTAESIGVTSVTLKWEVNDIASDSYTYRIEFVNDTFVKSLTFSDTKAEITDLIPGTPYDFTVFAVAADNETEGEGVSIELYTIPVPVDSFQCEPVAKQPFLRLKWKCPSGKNSGFRIKISNISESSESCMVEGSEQTFQTARLRFFSTYDVTIITLSNGSESSPVTKSCRTSITDPPPQTEVPSVKAVSHSSLSVEFSDFDSLNGPLEAYAVMITTEDQSSASLKSKLNNTYKDFKKKKTTAYVTYIIKTEPAESHSSPSQNGKNIINVGKGNTMHGYENGPLIPLHSYRACVAGFTNITFVANMIEGEDSYVSFSPCSEPVLLPQDPGVVAGVVIGCLLAIFAVVAVGGFIFWRRRRKDKRNADVSFSPIKIKKSKMIKVENFESYFKKQQADSNCGFAEEYEELKSAGVQQPKFAAELPENRGKNRYNNVLPYDISRVKLSNQSSGTGDYINANYMPGYNSKKAFIAAQGPLPNTIEDFWRMIWEKNIYSIVMLTKCVEQARTKCEQYWPDKQPKSYGDIIVTMVSEVVLPEWTIRDFTVEKSNTPESHTVRQFHFTSWPDHGVPETTDLLINFRHLVHEYNSQNPIDSPTLVHCSAGVGRTGTFIAIDRLIQQVEMESSVDVYGVVYDLRMHRPLMVQTEDQYVFLNQCVMDIIKSQRERQTDLIYQNVTAMAIYENVTPGPAFGKANGYHA